MSEFEEILTAAVTVVAIAAIGIAIIDKIQNADAIELRTPYGQIRTANYPSLNP